VVFPVGSKWDLKYYGVMNLCKEFYGFEKLLVVIDVFKTLFVDLVGTGRLCHLSIGFTGMYLHRQT